MSEVADADRHVVVLNGAFDPVAVAGRLARCAGFVECVAYERGGRWWVAGDALASVVLNRDVVRVQVGAEVTRRPWERRPGLALAMALDALPLPLARARAYGWATFEFAYAAAGRRDLLNGADLVHLFVPATELEVSATRVVVRSIDPVAAARMVDLVGTTDESAVRHGLPVEVDQEDPARFQCSVADALGHIRAGGLEKVILSRVVPVPFGVDFPATYVLGRRHNTPARSFLVDLGGWQAAGFSPEIVVSVDRQGGVSTEPLAATRAFGRGVVADALARADLLADPKEVFEHAISVRLACEEMGVVCQAGTVVVDDFMSLRERGSVQHLGSRVSGRLTDGASAWEAFEGLFPAVTASGIPKAAAYEQIVRLEAEPRGLYGGAVLQVGGDGSLDAALVLRSLLGDNSGSAWLRAGAGIVAGSCPQREYEETCEKLASVAPYIVPQSASW